MKTATRLRNSAVNMSRVPMISEPVSIIRRGSWTVLLQIGTKSQAVALIVAGSIVGGLHGIGTAVTALGCSIIGAGLADFGFSNEVNRSLASAVGTGMSLRFLRLATLRRMLTSAVVSMGLAIATIHSGKSILLIAAVGLLGAGLLVQAIYICAGFGANQFKNVSGISMRFKGASSVVVIVVALTHSQACILFSLALVEGALALSLVRQYEAVNREGWIERDQGTSIISRRFLWLGVAGVVNTLINRSDVVIVSASSRSDIAGLYGLASQAENLVTTLALVPAAGVMTYVAASRIGSSNAHRAAVSKVALVIAGICILGSVVAFTLIVTVGDAFVSGGSAGNKLTGVAFYCLLGAPFSVTGGVLLSALIGEGKYAYVGVLWICLAVISAPLLLVLSRVGGAIGAGQAALCRDILLCLGALGIWLLNGRNHSSSKLELQT